MVEKAYDITLDLVKKLQTQRIEFIRGDMKTCILNVTLKNNDAVVSLSGLAVQFFLKKADNTKVAYDSRYDTTIITITDAANGVIKVILPLQALAAIGYATGQISIIDGNTAKVTSQECSIYVRDGWDSALASESEIPVLQKLIGDTTSLQQQVDEAEVFRTNDENTRQANETDRKNNENIRLSAEIIRGSQESSRINNENSRAGSETTRIGNETTRQSNETLRQNNETTRQSIYNQFKDFVNSAQQISRVPYLFDGGDFGDTSQAVLTLNGGDF